MRISDGSSDVCSSDLGGGERRIPAAHGHADQAEARDHGQPGRRLRYRADAGVEVTEGKADVRRDCEAGDIVAHPAEEARSGVAAEITADRTAVAERQGEAVDRKGIGFAEEAERAYRVGESGA